MLVINLKTLSKVFLALVYVEQVFVQYSMIRFSVGCLKSVDSSDEAAQTVGFSAFIALTLLGFVSFDDSSSSALNFLQLGPLFREPQKWRAIHPAL